MENIKKINKYNIMTDNLIGKGGYGSVYIAYT